MNDDDVLLHVSKLYASALALNKTIEEHISSLPSKLKQSFDGFRADLTGVAASKVLNSILTLTVPTIKVQKLCPEATLPTRSMEAAGYDLYAVQEYEVMSGSVTMVKTGIAVELPPGYAGLIWPRSSSGLKGLTVLGGVVDQDYRGEIGVLLTSLILQSYTVRAGDRVGQLLIQPVVQLGLEEVPRLSDTSRGTGGFGSTGV